MLLITVCYDIHFTLFLTFLWAVLIYLNILKFIFTHPQNHVRDPSSITGDWTHASMGEAQSLNYADHCFYLFFNKILYYIKGCTSFEVIIKYWLQNTNVTFFLLHV